MSYIVPASTVAAVVAASKRQADSEDDDMELAAFEQASDSFFAKSSVQVPVQVPVASENTQLTAATKMKAPKKAPPKAPPFKLLDLPEYWFGYNGDGDRISLISMDDARKCLFQLDPDEPERVTHISLVLYTDVDPEKPEHLYSIEKMKLNLLRKLVCFFGKGKSSAMTKPMALKTLDDIRNL